MLLTPANRITGQEDGMIAACIDGRVEMLAHTQLLVTAIENVRLTLPSRTVLLELMEAYRDVVGERHRAIADVCAKLRAVNPPGPP